MVDFPFAEFGSDPVRKVRILVSPQTTGEDRCSIVITSVPPGGCQKDILTVTVMSIFFDIMFDLPL